VACISVNLAQSREFGKPPAIGIFRGLLCLCDHGSWDCELEPTGSPSGLICGDGASFSGQPLVPSLPFCCPGTDGMLRW
jgi:hypothetical protein